MSCDAAGVVKFWDIRSITTLETVHFGPDAANKMSLDPSGNTVAVASQNGFVKL